MSSGMMRYTYKGDKLTEPGLVDLQCDPVRRPDGKCIVSVKMATALVVDGNGCKHVVLRLKLRLNKQEDKIMQNLSPTQKIVLHQAEVYRKQASNLSHGAALGGWFTPSRYELAPVQCTIATCKALCAKGLFEYRVAFEAVNGMPAILEFRIKEQEGKMETTVNDRPATIRAGQWDTIAADVKEGRCKVYFAGAIIERVSRRKEGIAIFCPSPIGYFGDIESGLLISFDAVLTLEWQASEPAPKVESIGDHVVGASYQGVKYFGDGLDAMNKPLPQHIGNSEALHNDPEYLRLVIEGKDIDIAQWRHDYEIFRDASLRKDKEIKQLRAELDAANKRLEDNQRLAEEPILESFHYEDGKMNVLISHPVIEHIGSEMAAMFDENHAVNYVELEILHKASNRRFAFTIQLVTGLTPHQKADAAIAQADAYSKHLADIREVCLSPQDAIAAEWQAEVVTFPSSVVGLVKARMEQAGKLRVNAQYYLTEIQAFGRTSLDSGNFGTHEEWLEYMKNQCARTATTGLRALDESEAKS